MYKADDLMVAIDAPDAVSAAERAAILDNCERAGLSFYRIASGDRQAIISLWRQFGLCSANRTPESDDDGICCITVKPGARYVPYTNAPLCWHTDGYYSERAVRSFAMHCVRPAASGGDNSYINPTELYRALEDDAPEHITALMRDDAMTIPENVVDDEVVRARISAPVFSFDSDGKLHTRWTERARNIVWADDDRLSAAREAFQKVLLDNDFHIDKRLARGEGVLCNNILHTRTAFEDDPAEPRLLYRGRYYERIN